MTLPQVADGEDKLQIYRVSTGILNTLLRKACKEWPLIFGVGWCGGRNMTPQLHLIPRSGMREAIPPLPQHTSIAWCSV